MNFCFSCCSSELRVSTDCCPLLFFVPYHCVTGMACLFSTSFVGVSCILFLFFLKFSFCFLDDKASTVWAYIGRIFTHEGECQSLNLFWWCLRRVLASTHPIVLDVIFYTCWSIPFGTYWLGHLAKIKILTLESGLMCWCWLFHQLPRQHLKLSVKAWKTASLQGECLLNVDEAMGPWV